MTDCNWYIFLCLWRVTVLEIILIVLKIYILLIKRFFWNFVERQFHLCYILLIKVVVSIKRFILSFNIQVSSNFDASANFRIYVVLYFHFRVFETIYFKSKRQTALFDDCDTLIIVMQKSIKNSSSFIVWEIAFNFREVKACLIKCFWFLVLFFIQLDFD